MKSQSTRYRRVRKAVDADMADIEKAGYDGGTSSSDDENFLAPKVRCRSPERVCALNSANSGSSFASSDILASEVNTNLHKSSIGGSVAELSSEECEACCSQSVCTCTSLCEASTDRDFHCDSDCSSCNEKESQGFQNDTSILLREVTFVSELRRWAISSNIPSTTLGGLLKILHPVLPNLPKDPRTLLGSKPVKGVEPMGNGDYFNFGILPSLKRTVDVIPSLTNLFLNFNVDGMPVFKSSNTECWPILCLVFNSNLPPFVCAVYCGSGKPPLHSFFIDFVPELKLLMQTGFDHKGKHYNVIFQSFICDAPAKAFVRGTVGHTGYYGCGNCTQKGMWKGRMTFPSMNSPVRTDESFVEMLQPEHHSDRSPLLALGIGMVTSFPLDYLHLVCLGAGRSLIYWLIKGKKKVRKRQISDTGIARMNRGMALAKDFWPRDFSRKPRSFKDIKRWKATEFRQLILYLVAVILRGDVAGEKYYELALLLHIAVTILCREDLYHKLNDVAEQALIDFVNKSKTLFGIQFLSYNIHNLLHLAPDCRRYGKLDKFSAFPFENELQVLKHTIRGKSKPLQQLVGRISERQREYGLVARSSMVGDGVVESSSHKGGPRLNLHGQAYSKVMWKSRKISVLDGDNAIALESGDIVLAKNFIVTGEGTFIIGSQFMKYTNLYDSPIESSDLGIYEAHNLNERLGKWPLSSIKHKVVAVPMRRGDTFAVYPLVN